VSNIKDDRITVADREGQTYSAQIEGRKLRVGHLIFTPRELLEANLKISACEPEEAAQLKELGFLNSQSVPKRG